MRRPRGGARGLCAGVGATRRRAFDRPGRDGVAISGVHGAAAGADHLRRLRLLPGEQRTAHRRRAALLSHVWRRATAVLDGAVVRARRRLQPRVERLLLGERQGPVARRDGDDRATRRRER
eukprot:990849-Prymnesium_polylepis.1